MIHAAGKIAVSNLHIGGIAAYDIKGAIVMSGRFEIGALRAEAARYGGRHVRVGADDAAYPGSAADDAGIQAVRHRARAAEAHDA